MKRNLVFVLILAVVLLPVMALAIDWVELTLTTDQMKLLHAGGDKPLKLDLTSDQLTAVLPICVKCKLHQATLNLIHVYNTNKINLKFIDGELVSIPKFLKN